MRPHYGVILFCCLWLVQAESAQGGAIEATLVEPEFELSAPEATELEAVEVEDDFSEETEPLSRSTTRITRETLQERSPRDVYDALIGTPGVAIEGGARSQGKRVVIRGYSDNEDVLVRVDGASQNFEKYRYGSGIDIDPELVRTIDVIRGAATLTQGSGALGGVVTIETLDPSDLLQDDALAGGAVALGYATNDRSQRVTGNLFARPLEALELLYSRLKREGGNLRFPGGEELPDSSEFNESTLYKLVTHAGPLDTEIMHREGSFEGLQPLDVATGVAGVFGNVRRLTSEESSTVHLELTPDSPWLDAEASLGRTTKAVIDQDSQLAGGGDDSFDYDIYTLDVRNTALWSWNGLDGKLMLGAQGVREARDTFRDSPTFQGPNMSQPPGVKQSYGGFLEHEFFIHDFTLKTALRWDHYAVQAGGLNKDFLIAQDRSTEISFARFSPGIGLEYNPGGGGVTFFYDYFESFRPPLIDEYFASGSFSRCQSFLGYASAPELNASLVLPPRPTATAPSIAQCNARPTPVERALCLASRPALLVADANALQAWSQQVNALAQAFDAEVQQFLAAQSAYDADPFSDQKAICGDAYVPESARNHEIGVSYLADAWLHADDHLYAKLSYFRSDVSNVLESIYQDAVTGEIQQPGIETRMGIEAQINYSIGKWRAEAALSTLWGSFELRYFENNRNPIVHTASASDRQRQALFDTPGNNLTLSLARDWHATVSSGYRIRATAARRIVTGVRDDCATGSFVIPSCNLYGTQPGFVLHNLYVRWEPQPEVSVQLAADNLTNETYNLTGFGGGLGILAPGRDVALTLRLTF